MKVAPIESTDGMQNLASQEDSGGMWPPKTTRFAGLEIGKTKLAALAMKAQMKR